MGILPRVLGATIKVEFAPGAALWPTLVDPGQLQTALINLAVNARDAMPEGGSLTIATSNRPLDQTHSQHVGDLQPGDYVQLSLKDTGEGMSSEVAKRAFEPFFTTKPVGKGTGLGLSMVFGFVKQSGGHVELHSEQGRGTTVHLLLPRASQTEAADEKAPQRPVSSSIAHGTGVVLLVEDEPAIRETTRTFLKDLGYRVLEAPSGPKAIAMLEKSEPVDILFTDVILPHGMNGVEIARQALRIRPNLKVLFASGYTKEILVHEARLGTDVTLLQKPYRKHQLAEALKTLLE
jgi:CheY-like chemotaxis protein